MEAFFFKRTQLSSLNMLSLTNMDEPVADFRRWYHSTIYLILL